MTTTTRVSSQSMILPLGERSSSQENSQPDRRHARSNRKAHNPVTIVISDDSSSSQSSSDDQDRQAELQDCDDDDDDEAILSEPLFDFDQPSCFAETEPEIGCSRVKCEDFPEPSQNSRRASPLRKLPDLETLDDGGQKGVFVKQELLDQMVVEDDSEDEGVKGTAGAVSTSNSEVNDEEMEAQKHHIYTKAEDEETDLDVLRFRGHLSAFVSNDGNVRRGQGSLKADSSRSMAPPASKRIAKKPKIKSPARSAEAGSSIDADGSKPSARPTTAKSKGKARAKSQVREEDSSSAAAQSETATPETKIVRKRRAKTPPPDPIDLDKLASTLFLILTSCPLCGESFPKYKSGTVRRKHVGVCAAKQALDADLIDKVVREEVARLDKAERANQAQEDELKATWDLILEERGIPIVHDKTGPGKPGQSSGMRKRKLVGSAGSLLIAPAESQRVAARGMLLLLDGDDTRDGSASRSSSRKLPDQTTEEPTLGLDHKTGDVISDVCEPAFAFPGDQFVAEAKFLSTQIAPSRGLFPATEADASLSMFTMRSPTQSFTQAPSTTIRSRSSSRLWKRRRPVPGAGTGLGAECLPLSSGMCTFGSGSGEYTAEEQQQQQHHKR